MVPKIFKFNSSLWILKLVPHALSSFLHLLYRSTIVSNNISHSYTTWQLAEHLNICYLVWFLQFCAVAAMVSFISQMGRCSFRGVKWHAYGHWLQLEIKLSSSYLVDRCSFWSHKLTSVGKTRGWEIYHHLVLCQPWQQSASEQWTHRNKRLSLLEITKGVCSFCHPSEGPHKSFK